MPSMPSMTMNSLKSFMVGKMVDLNMSIVIICARSSGDGAWDSLG